MWVLTVCLFLGAGESSSAADASSTHAAKSTSRDAIEPRSLSAISLDLNRLLKQEAVAQQGSERFSAILSLTDLYVEMMQDERNDHPFLKNMRAQLRSRLVRVRDDLKRQIAREEQPERGNKQEPAEADAEDELALRQSLAISLAASDQSVSSPALAFSFGGGSITDVNGQALVELIERTINPAFWDTNGGTGSVIYYAPLQCLVVTATGHIHEELGGLLDGVRQAGQ